MNASSSSLPAYSSFASSSSNSSTSITNVFARLLVFYDMYKRGKLTNEDLGKIAKKYGKSAAKSAQLPIDLAEKYPDYVFPASVSLTAVRRLAAVWPVPPEFTLLLAPDIYGGSGGASGSNADAEYVAEIDICSHLFDPQAVFQRGRLIAPEMHSDRLDNLSKVRWRIPQLAPPGSSSSTATDESDAASVPNKKEKVVWKKRTRPEEPYQHIVDAIAEDSILEKRAASVGPLQLLLDIMRAKDRARVVIRSRNGIRGTMVGYLLAFDRHFNLVLADVDERYSLDPRLLPQPQLGIAAAAAAASTGALEAGEEGSEEAGRAGRGGGATSSAPPSALRR